MVLATSGMHPLAVPCRGTGFLEEFKRRAEPSGYWAISDQQTIFGQRLYDRLTLRSRVLGVSDLGSGNVSRWSERDWAVEGALLNPRRPRPLRVLMLSPQLSRTRIVLRGLGEGAAPSEKVASLTLRRAVG